MMMMVYIFQRAYCNCSFHFSLVSKNGRTKSTNRDIQISYDASEVRGCLHKLSEYRHMGGRGRGFKQNVTFLFYYYYAEGLKKQGQVRKNGEILNVIVSVDTYCWYGPVSSKFA